MAIFIPMQAYWVEILPSVRFQDGVIRMTLIETPIFELRFHPTYTGTEDLVNYMIDNAPSCHLRGLHRAHCDFLVRCVVEGHLEEELKARLT